MPMKAHCRRAAGDTQVELVTLDSGSLAHYGRWPWPDAGLTELTRAVAARRAGLIFATPLDRPESDSFPAPLAGGAGGGAGAAGRGRPDAASAHPF